MTNIKVKRFVRSIFRKGDYKGYERPHVKDMVDTSCYEDISSIIARMSPDSIMLSREKNYESDLSTEKISDAFDKYSITREADFDLSDIPEIEKRISDMKKAHEEKLKLAKAEKQKLDKSPVLVKPPSGAPAQPDQAPEAESVKPIA